MHFVHKAHGWTAECSLINDQTGESVLKVKSQEADEDWCAGQDRVISAFYRACELLDLTPVGEYSHSGGCVTCKVQPDEELAEAEDQD